MKEKNIKAVIALVIFFILDLIKPFGYSLQAELLFLGIIYISLNYPLYFTLILSIVFGYFKDSLSYGVIALSLLEFPILSLFIRYFLHHFYRKETKFVIFFSALIIHIIINAVYMGITSYLFSLVFFVQSSVIFLLINYLLKKWINPLPFREGYFADET